MSPCSDLRLLKHGRLCETTAYLFHRFAGRAQD